MQITENFVRNILQEDFPKEYRIIYDNSLLLQYLDKKNESGSWGL